MDTFEVVWFNPNFSGGRHGLLGRGKGGVAPDIYYYSFNVGSLFVILWVVMRKEEAEEEGKGGEGKGGGEACEVLTGE